jgi:hypothetical protein
MFVNGGEERREHEKMSQRKRQIYREEGRKRYR